MSFNKVQEYFDLILNSLKMVSEFCLYIFLFISSFLMKSHFIFILIS